MPKLWSETIEAHRLAVRDAVLDATAELVREHGLAAVTMSRVAEEARIGRATLYKYFPDVEAILAAWHERQVARHLAQLADVGEHSADPGRIAAVLRAYALIHHEHHGGRLAALLHRGEHMAGAQRQLTAFLAGLLADGVGTGAVRSDVAPDELADYCVHALEAAATLPSEAAVARLVTVTLAGLRP